MVFAGVHHRRAGSGERARAPPDGVPECRTVDPVLGVTEQRAIAEARLEHLDHRRQVHTTSFWTSGLEPS